MRALTRLLMPLRRRIQLLINRAVINAVKSGEGFQLVQVSTGKNETLHDLKHHEPYGFTSKPLSGAQALAASLGGSRSHSLVFMVSDRRYRLTGLEDGEVALYDNQEPPQVIVLKQNGIEIEAPNGYTVNGDGVLNGAVQITGAVQMDSTLDVADVANSPDFISDGKSGATHVHGGVSSGGSSTAPPS